MKALPPRPSKDFVLCSVAGDRAIADKFTRAGFAALTDDHIRNRLWVYLEFLQTHGFTTRVIVPRKEEVSADTALRNSDLTDAGFLFLQKIQGKWDGRLFSGSNPAKEKSLLKKWFAKHADGRRDPPPEPTYPAHGST